MEKGVTYTEEEEYAQNLQAKIRNPLKGIPREQLMTDVESFASRHGLTEHTLLLKKGALIAQNPAEAHNIDGDEKLTSHELNILEREVTHKWHMPARLFITIATCSIGAAVQGWDQTGSNGATIFWPDVYGIGDQSITRNAILVGLINAAPYIGSAYVQSPLVHPLIHF